MPLLRVIFFILVLGSTYLFPIGNDLLKPSDINKVMQEILRQHVSQKTMTDQILKTSFKVYVDQFDPERYYLLQSEVIPFLNIKETQLPILLQQYNEQDFSVYDHLNKVIQDSIERARSIRHELMQNPRQLFLYQKTTHNKNSKTVWDDPDLNRPFAKNQLELKNRIKQQLIQYIDGEINLHGIGKIKKNEKAILAFYESRMREKENKYLFQNSLGKELSGPEKSNLLVLHILKALTRSLDAHTTFYDAVEAYDMKIRLEKGVVGVGLIPQETDEGISVSKIIPDGPAAKSGLFNIDDLFLSIDGASVNSLSLEQVMNKLQPKPGTIVSLELKKNDHPVVGTKESTYKVSLKSEAIPINEGRVEIAYQPLDNGILGVITLNSFYQGLNGINSEQDVRNALKELTKYGPLKGLILDLRENSGGFLSQAVKVAGLFITNGVIVISKYSNGEARFYRDMDGVSSYNGPLIVLTSKATASAAEIVAQALQDYGVALVVGDEQTYGKGTIQSQTITDNKGSSYFKVTVGKYYTVSGKTPQIHGVKADIVVASQLANDTIGEEFLEYSLNYDKISSAYEDLLEDIETDLKPWYLQYYLPTLQNKVQTWRSMIPLLKKNSTNRLANNATYQQFLNGQSPQVQKTLEINNEQPNIQDVQLTEALNILKDMNNLKKSPVRSKNSLYVENTKNHSRQIK